VPEMKRHPTIYAFVAMLMMACAVPAFCNAQQQDWRSRIDQVVHQADSLAMIKQLSFHLNKFDLQNRPIREIWHYTLQKNNVVIFEVHHFIDSTEYDEVYYLDNGRLVCIEEYTIKNPFSDDDEIISGSVGFFSQDNLRQHITMGKSTAVQSADYAWDANKKFRYRLKELTVQRTLMEH
jgi:hypothetical protein